MSDTDNFDLFPFPNGIALERPRSPVRAPAGLLANPEALKAYRREVFNLPSEVDRWVMHLVDRHSERPEPSASAKDFPTFGIDDYIKGAFSIRVVPESDEHHNFLPCTSYYLDLTLFIDEDSGFILVPGPSPRINIDHFSRHDHSNGIDTPEWVMNEHHIQGLTFYQSRAVMLELVKGLMETYSILPDENTEAIRIWCYQASHTHRIKNAQIAKDRHVV